MCVISAGNISPVDGENRFPEYSISANFSPVASQNVTLLGEKFKAGINIYSMSFLLRLLERKECLIELLKSYNSECGIKRRENVDWKPDNDF